MYIENWHVVFLILIDIALVILLIVSQVSYRKDKREFNNNINNKKW